VGERPEEDGGGEAVFVYICGFENGLEGEVEYDSYVRVLACRDLESASLMDALQGYLAKSSYRV
jgi:hypothetical protein